MKVQKWRQGILSFTSKADVKNPFLDIVITAEFTGPSGRKITREAYWDGENQYKVSFAPTETGIWTYRLTAPEQTGLHNNRGEIECVAYTGDLPIYKHGFIKVSDQKNYLTYHDGTPFFWLGDTHWGFVSGERWDQSNHPQMQSMFKGMVDRRCEQGFTVYQTNLRPESYMGNTHYWQDGCEGTLPDVGFYQNEVDKRMLYIADKGLVNALGFAWFMSILHKPEVQKNLTRYIVARYGALPIVWTLAGEVAGYDKANRQACIDGWREIALLVEKLDGGYHTLQTAHYTNERPFAHYYQNEDWFDFTLNQAGHGDFVISAKDYRQHRSQFPDKPFIESEGMYEFVHTLEENGARVADADMVRRVAYITMQTGGCGYTYGAQGIWDTVWEKGTNAGGFNIFNPHDVTWYEAVDGVGACQMGYMRAFYEKHAFHTLKPAMNCFDSGGASFDESLFGMFTPYLTASEDMGTIILYFTGLSRSENACVRNLKNAAYEVKWFDPRENRYIGVEETMVPDHGKFKLPGRPDNRDWLLVIRQKTCN